MATWNSRRTVKWSYDAGFDYAACENHWSYGTVSDFLTIITKMDQYSTYTGYQPASEKITHYSKSEALALLETLIDWAETYEGKGTVEDLLKQRIAKDMK